MRIVADTNVYISALVFNKKIQELLVNLLEDHTLIISPFILDELQNKLLVKFNFTPDEINNLITQLTRITKLITPFGDLPATSPDKDDNNILLLADFARAELIISGDKHLYSLKSYKNIPIVKPSDFER